MFLTNYNNYRHLYGRKDWCKAFDLRDKPIWVLRVAQECMLGLPVSYTKELEMRVARPVSPDYEDLFKRRLAQNNYFANTIIWC